MGPRCYELTDEWIESLGVFLPFSPRAPFCRCLALILVGAKSFSTIAKKGTKEEEEGEEEEEEGEEEVLMKIIPGRVMIYYLA